MDHQHTRMMYQNLAAVGNYAHQMLAKLSRGAGELPQWTNHILSTVRTHVGDVTHYLRHEDSQGRQYGMSGMGMAPWYGKAGLEPSGENKRPVPDDWGAQGGRQYGNARQLEVQASREGRSVESLARQYGVPGRPFGTPGWYGQGGVATIDSGFLAGPRSYAGSDEPASMARKNLREIEAYAKEARAHFKKGAGIAPAWVEHKLSMAASQMDAMGHWLENEAVEGRQYGSHLTPVPGDAGDEPYLYGYADGIGGEYRGANWEGHPFGRKIYDDAYRKGQKEATLPNIKQKRAYFYGRADGLRETYLGHLWDDTPYEDDYDKGWREGFGVEARREEEDDGPGERGGGSARRGPGPGDIEILRGPVISRKQLGRTYAGNLAAKFENYQAPFRNYGLSTGQKFEGDSPSLRPHSQAEGIRRYGVWEAVDVPKVPPPRGKETVPLGYQKYRGPTMGRKRTKKAFRRYGGAISGVGGVESMTLAQVVNMEASAGFANRPWRSLQPGMGPVQEYGSMGYGSMGVGSMDQSVQGAKKGITRGAKGVSR